MQNSRRYFPETDVFEQNRTNDEAASANSLNLFQDLAKAPTVNPQARQLRERTQAANLSVEGVLGFFHEQNQQQPTNQPRVQPSLTHEEVDPRENVQDNNHTDVYNILAVHPQVVTYNGPLVERNVPHNDIDDQDGNIQEGDLTNNTVTLPDNETALPELELRQNVNLGNHHAGGNLNVHVFEGPQAHTGHQHMHTIHITTNIQLGGNQASVPLEIQIPDWRIFGNHAQPHTDAGVHAGISGLATARGNTTSTVVQNINMYLPAGQDASGEESEQEEVATEDRETSFEYENSPRGLGKDSAPSGPGG
jgi:hypothetical protein